MTHWQCMFITKLQAHSVVHRYLAFGVRIPRMLQMQPFRSLLPVLESGYGWRELANDFSCCRTKIYGLRPRGNRYNTYHQNTCFPPDIVLFLAPLCEYTFASLNIDYDNTSSLDHWRDREARRFSRECAAQSQQRLGNSRPHA